MSANKINVIAYRLFRFVRKHHSGSESDSDYYDPEFCFNKKKITEKSLSRLVDRLAIPGNPCFIEIDHFTHIYIKLQRFKNKSDIL